MVVIVLGGSDVGMSRLSIQTVWGSRLLGSWATGSFWKSQGWSLYHIALVVAVRSMNSLDAMASSWGTCSHCSWLGAWHVLVSPRHASWLRRSSQGWGIVHVKLVRARLLSMQVFTLLHICKHAQTTNWWNQTWNDFLCHIFSGGSKQVFKLDRAELLDDSWLFGDTVLESRFKLIQLTFLFVEILYQASPSLLHLIETSLEAYPEWCLVSLAMLDLVISDRVLGVPDIMSNELFDLNFPTSFQIIVIDVFDFIHQSLYILNQDVITSDQDSLLLTW